MPVLTPTKPKMIDPDMLAGWTTENLVRFAEFAGLDITRVCHEFLADRSPEVLERFLKNPSNPINR